MKSSGESLPVIGGLRPYQRHRISEAFRRAIRLGTSALDVARGAVWLFDRDGRRLHRLDLYHRSADEHSSGGTLDARQYPTYFRALREDPRLAVANVYEDPRTAELVRTYAAPHGISAWLDTPLEIQGHPGGLLRFEHVGPPREWSETERRVARDLAGVVSAVLDSEGVDLGTDVRTGDAAELEARPGPGTPGESEKEREIPALRAADLSTERPAGSRAVQGEDLPDQQTVGERHPSLLDVLPAAAIRASIQGEIVYSNTRFARLAGASDPDSLEGRFLTEFMTPPDAWLSLASQVREERELVGEEIEFRRANGSTTWLLVNAQLLEGEEGEETVVLAGVDIRERKSVEERLIRQAHRDPLTGAANRRLFRETADQAFALAERQRRQAGLLYIDLRHFKAVNDRFGHDVGDRVLTHVADRLRARGRESDLTARIGGDEFAVLLTEVEGLEGVRKAAERVQESLKRPIQVDDRAIQVGATIGLAVFPDHGRDVRTLLRRADDAMYRAKAEDMPDIAAPRSDSPDAGRGGEEEAPSGDAADPPAPRMANGVGALGEESRHEVLPRTMDEELRETLENGDLEVHYQPIFQMAGQEMVGAEALLRWPRPDGEVLEAKDFIGIAEAEGFVTDLDRWTLRQVASKLHRWVGGGLVEWVSVNLSPVTLFSYDLVGFLNDLSEWGEFPRSALMLEISLDRSRIPMAEAHRTVSRLRSEGFRVALDFQGEGVADEPVSLMSELDVDLVKMEPALLMRRGRDISADSLDRESAWVVVAKKVETAQEQGSALEAACTLVQGQHFASPVPAGELENWR